jgi:hypothetical protein
MWNYTNLNSVDLLDAFAKLQKASISFVMSVSVRPSHGTTRSPLNECS